MAEFVPTPGFANCPKCGGWQVLDYTKRNRAMEPTGPLDHRDCDKCDGAGQIRLTPLPINKPTPRQREKAEIDNWPINDIDDLPTPEPAAKPAACWHLNKHDVWGRLTCKDCGAQL